MSDTYSLRNLTRSATPLLPWEILKTEILHKEYDLSVALLGKTRMRRINKSMRQKNYATNVLAFPLTETSGEILLCPQVIKQEMNSFNRGYRQHTLALYIHGLLHLAGHDHSPEMEKLEQQYFDKHKQ